MKGALLAAFLLAGALAARAADPVQFSVGGFSFDRPEGWKWVPPSSAMRKAHLTFSAPDGSLADIVFFHFGPGQGGSVQANVERWLAQFQSPAETKTERASAGTTPVTFVEAQGTFLSGMPGTPSIPMEGFALLGAILESAGGDVYVKMTGPAKAVEAAAPAFRAMVAGAK